LLDQSERLSASQAVIGHMKLVKSSLTSVVGLFDTAMGLHLICQLLLLQASVKVLTLPEGNMWAEEGRGNMGVEIITQ